MKQYLDFTDQVVLVTGARSGIGQATAVAFAGQGAKVIVSGRRPCDETLEQIKEVGGEGECIICDVSNEDEVKALIDAIIAKYGKLDVAVNSAGVNSVKKPIEEQDMENYDRVNNTDARGLFMCMMYEARAMLPAGKGAIVNIASVAGLIADPLMSPYVGAKHAVVGMTKAAGIELAQKGIRVNGICPGFVDTEMTQAWSKDPEAKARVAGYNMQKRPAVASEIATVALFLGSDMASFMNGAVLPVEAGQTAH
ncbi:MAG: SDR family oxidoreductase [Eggerthellaceae bacterium]|nr:SDR family oxidoreductase [Eggerthellaceae bacterium]